MVDSTAMQLIRQPRAYDVILTENMFGDILSDEASVLGGSIGLAPSASLGAKGPGLFEPVHGSAPDIAGRNICNPIGGILSVALLLRYGLGLLDEANAVEAAVERIIDDGARTTDLGGALSCSAMAELIADEVLKSVSHAHHACSDQAGRGKSRGAAQAVKKRNRSAMVRSIVQFKRTYLQEHCAGSSSVAAIGRRSK